MKGDIIAYYIIRIHSVRVAAGHHSRHNGKGQWPLATQKSQRV